ncbi:MAG: uncharacterized protein QOF98_1031, partial [Streptomyces sp.]|nr:uncharacterized protein [Streptomyces sp.]
VHNRRTYPHLVRLFAELGIPTRETDMTMSVRCRGCGLEYAGGKQAAGLLPRAGREVWRAYARMLTEIPRFHRDARRLLAGAGPEEAAPRQQADSGQQAGTGQQAGSGQQAASGQGGPTLGDVLSAGRYSAYFADHFALPLVSAVWSAGEDISPRYPARHLFAFLDQHGLLDTRAAAKWRTVAGGSRTYVERIGARLSTVRTATPVRAVRRHADGVEVVDDSGAVHAVDRVVIATHADQALALLADPTAAEKQILGAFTYSRNEVWLHTDSSVLPAARRSRASWNYLKSACHGGERAVVSYDMNRLMRLSEPQDHIVTLNGEPHVDASSVLARMTYEHPVYTLDAVAAQRRLAELNHPRVAYAGAYQGWGFHEDGCASGVRAAAAFGVSW